MPCLSLLASSVAFAASPFFDCAKATGPVETLLCKDDALATLDRREADTYTAQMASTMGAGKAAAQGAQRRWLGRRNACGQRQDVKACVRDLYETRVTELEIATGRAHAPAPTQFTCGKQGVPAYFYNEVPRPAALVYVGANVQDLATRQPSASGAGYQGPKLGFWTKGNDAILTLCGKPDIAWTQKK